MYNPQISKIFIQLWMLVLIVVAIYIRVEGDNYYYHPDEIMHIDIAKAPTLAGVLKFSLFETHPPLGHILRHYWLTISEDIGFVRDLSLLFGIAIILLYYQIGNMLGGRFTGMCAAAFAAFSHGLIVQSYVVRNYSIFLFFLSLGLYYYLQWQKEPSQKRLLAYALFSILACLTHFSAIFAIAPIAAYETIRLYLHKSPTRILAAWIITNLLLASISAITYYLWLETNAPFSFSAFHEAYLTAHGRFSAAALWISALFYPQLAFNYVLPNHQVFYVIIPVFIMAFSYDKKLSSFSALAGIALLLGMLMVASGTYQYMSSRRTIWILPFVIPVAAMTLADSVLWIVGKLSEKKSWPWLELASLIILAGGFLCYDETIRYSESGDISGGAVEYNKILPPELKEIENYLSKLDDQNVIILGRGEVFLFSQENPYMYMNNNALKEGNLALMPYFNTHIVFSTSYYAPQIILDGHIPNLIDNKDNFVFIKTPFTENITDRLMACSALDKKMVNFSVSAIVIISKKDLLEQLFSPNGKAHGCLNKENNDSTLTHH